MLILGRQPGTTQAPQLRFAVQPERTTEPSEVNRKVRQPVLELMVPGEVVPEKTPSKGDPVVGPSNISNSSKPVSRSNAVKVTETQLLAFEQMVKTEFSLFA